MMRKRVLDAAIFAQSRLDEAMPLVRLAAAAGMSPHHFHREFARQTGETPAAFVQRLRLEKAAFRLLLHDDAIVAVAMDCGYANHETLSRAFRRQFGVTPRDYRRQARLALSSRRAARTGDAGDLGYELSATRVVRLQPLPIAYIRVLGPYEDVDTGLWRTLIDWSEARGHPPERMLIGIGHDSPGITPPQRLRFDACITVPPGMEGGGDVRIGALPSLTCAVTTHVGPYATLPAAYPVIFSRAASLRGLRIVGLPAVEIYRDASVDSLRPLCTTDIYLPVEGGTP